MRRFLYSLAALLAILIAGGAAFALSIPKPDPDDPPPLIAEDSYVVHVTSRVIDAPRQETKKWLEERKLVSFMERTAGIPAVISTTPISGQWGASGATRFANLDDGNTAIDRIIENREPDLFHYQIFGFTSTARFIISHVVGRIEYEELTAQSTKITWSYAIAPRAFFTRPLAGLFLRNRFTPFMEVTMDRMAEAANREL
jgi:hypothetical protein